MRRLILTFLLLLSIAFAQQTGEQTQYLKGNEVVLVTPEEGKLCLYQTKPFDYYKIHIYQQQERKVTYQVHKPWLGCEIREWTFDTTNYEPGKYVMMLEYRQPQIIGPKKWVYLPFIVE